MRDVIMKELREIEEKHNVTILFAIESGSRGWGFSSSDSDYDVRFVYKHNSDWYVSIEEERDVIEIPVDEVLDINGWDIRKALRLATKSNFVLWEWLQSPVVYIEEENFRKEMLKAIAGRFSPISMAHSYLSLAKRTMEQHYQDTTILMKKYFYIIRPLFCALWIIEKGTVPPMEFKDLLPLVTGEEEFLAAISDLIEIKSGSSEGDRCDRIPAIDTVIDATLERVEKEITNLTKASGDYKPLNLFLRETIS